MQIGPYVLSNNLVVAPMAGITDRPFRQLCKKLGAGYAVSEMAAANPLLRDTLKSRKLLMHAGEIRRLIGKSREKGWAIIPVAMYFKGRLVKVEIALARGKRAYDKKQTIKERDSKRDMDRQLAELKRR